MSRWRELAENAAKRMPAKSVRTVMCPQQPAVADPHHLQAGNTHAPDTAMLKMPELPKIEPTNVFGNFGNSGDVGRESNVGTDR